MGPTWTWLIVACALPAQLRLSVNIPAYRLDIYVGDSLARTMPVAVGMPRFRTPRGSFTVTSVEWNPWWNPPKSAWAAKEKVTPPGPGNPMGRVKINFAASYFLHGTPVPQSVGSAASHGCLRMRNEDAIELARLVHRYGTNQDAERYVVDTATRWVRVDSTVPIDVRYDLAEVREGLLFVYRDIYGLATQSLAADAFAVLAAHGIDGARVDSARVRELVRKVDRAGNRLALDSLVRQTPVP